MYVDVTDAGGVQKSIAKIVTALSFYSLQLTSQLGLTIATEVEKEIIHEWYNFNAIHLNAYLIINAATYTLTWLIIIIIIISVRLLEDCFGPLLLLLLLSSSSSSSSLLLEHFN
jgi:hypothetical protein